MDREAWRATVDGVGRVNISEPLSETPVLWPPHAKSWLTGKDWFWEGLGAGGEGDDRGWDGWMASRTRWMWVWVNSRSWWWTGRPGVLQFMGSQRDRHDWATSLSLFTFMHWRRKWQPTPVFLPGESQVTGEPGGLPSMGSHRVGHSWSDLAAAAAVLYTHSIIVNYYGCKG